MSEWNLILPLTIHFIFTIAVTTIFDYHCVKKNRSVFIQFASKHKTPGTVHGYKCCNSRGQIRGAF